MAVVNGVKCISRYASSRAIHLKYFVPFYLVQLIRYLNEKLRLIARP